MFLGVVGCDGFDRRVLVMWVWPMNTQIKNVAVGGLLVYQNRVFNMRVVEFHINIYFEVIMMTLEVVAQPFESRFYTTL